MQPNLLTKLNCYLCNVNGKPDEGHHRMFHPESYGFVLNVAQDQVWFEKATSWTKGYAEGLTGWVLSDNVLTTNTGYLFERDGRNMTTGDDTPAALQGY